MTKHSKAQPEAPASATPDTMLEEALDLARAGYAVFPIWPVDPKHKKGTGKHPRCKHGHNDATTDEAQITRWWSKPERGDPDAWQCSPDNNIGIAVPEGLVIVDIDPRNGGWETLDKIEAEHGLDWLLSLTAHTGGDGEQIYLSCEPGRRFPKNLDGHFGPGIDLKQCGGFVVAPPSKHKSGGAYSWDQTTGDIAPAPAWLTLLSKVRSKSDVAPAPDVPDGAELDDLMRDKLDRATEAIEPFYVESEKHYLALAIGGYFRNKSLPPIAARYVVSQLPSEDYNGRVADAVWAWGPDVHKPRGASELRERWPELLTALDALRLDLLEHARDKREARKAAEHADQEGANWQTPAADTADPDHYILQSATHAETILLWRGADRGHQPVAIGSLRLAIKEAGLTSKLPLDFEMETASGKPKTVKFPAPTLVEKHGKQFDHMVHDFARRVSVYEPEHSRVIVGYPDAAPSGVFDAEVDAWLRALGGEHYARLAVWIASCGQRHIDKLSACLVVIGPTSTGKSMFSCAVAGLWGQADPPAAQLLVSRFNGGLSKCPVVADEEAQLFGGGKYSTKQFRDTTQRVERQIELKGQETFTLRGALRIIVPCNEISDLHFDDCDGPDVVKAVSDRLLVLNCKARESECREALTRLRPHGEHRVNLPRVIGHMAWLCESVELPAERFLGAGGAGEGSVLAGAVGEHVDLWERFRDWLEADGPGAEPALWVATAKRGLCADTAALALALENTGRGWELRQVRAALAPFKAGDYQPDNGARRRLWVLDSAKVAAALGLDADARARLEAKLAEAKAEAKPQPRDAKRRFGKAHG